MLKRLKHPNVLNFMGLLLDKDNQMCFLVGRYSSLVCVQATDSLVLVIRLHRWWDAEEHDSRSIHSIDMAPTPAVCQGYRCRHGTTHERMSVEYGRIIGVV